LSGICHEIESRRERVSRAFGAGNAMTKTMLARYKNRMRHIHNVNKGFLKLIGKVSENA
jgi:hypothetical protein